MVVNPPADARSPGEPDELDDQDRRRSMWGLGGGMTVEWYDFAIYGLMAAFLGPHFFPSTDPVASTLSALIVFAVGFGARPLSALIFSPFADTIGHKKVLLISIAIMSVATLVIGVIPTYETLGVWAGVILVACRLAQGMSAGVEVPVATAASVELARPGQAGKFTGWVLGSFSQFGVLLASLVALGASAVFGGEAMADWAWRVPFVLGGCLGLIVLYLRRSLPDTGAGYNAENAEEDLSKSAVWQVLGRHKLSLLAIVFVVGGTQVANYIWTAGLPNLALSSFQEDATAVFAVTTALSIILTVTGPFAGMLADRFGGSTVFTVTRLMLAPTFFATLLYAAPGLGGLTAVMLLGGVVVALNQTLFPFIAASLMPAMSRSTGVAIGYGFGVAVFGGTAPYLLLWFQQRDISWILPCYAAALCVVSVVLYAAVKRKGRIYVGT